MAIMSGLALATLLSGLATAAGSFFGQRKTSPELDKQALYDPQQEQYLKGITSQLGDPTASLFDYINDLLSDSPEALERFTAPYMRQFQEDIIPGIAEKFAGEGVTPMQSSAFEQALGRGGEGLTERLAALRESMKPEAANLLGGMQNLGLTPTFGYLEPQSEITGLGGLGMGASKLLPTLLSEILQRGRPTSGATTGSVTPTAGTPGGIG